jgi:hypothetical protein
VKHHTIMTDRPAWHWESTASKSNSPALWPAARYCLSRLSKCQITRVPAIANPFNMARMPAMTAGLNIKHIR